MVFVDGLGLGADDSASNPIHSGACPVLEELLRCHAVAVDARLGVEGTPQSATGQTALLTGLNAPQMVGQHVEGFPGRALSDIVREHNIFRQLADRGLTSTFANAYYHCDSAEQAWRGRRQSVTTVAAMSAFGKVRDIHDLERGEAVYQDVTRHLLRERGYDGALVSPGEAAVHLLNVASAHDLTLFEYFQTDRAGHRADIEAARGVLGTLDGLLGPLCDAARRGEVVLLLSSDHGNIEDLCRRGHTLNPVPLVALGPDAEALQEGVGNLTDITPRLVAWMTGDLTGRE